MSADAIVKSYIDRILRLKEEQDTLAADIREVYAEAKGSGYDKTAMGQLVAHLRKVEKVGISAVQEGQSIFDLYLEAYERASGTALATHTHEAKSVDRQARAKQRTSEAMDDNKAFSAELLAAGLISEEAHAENIAISDGMARKYGAGVIDPETGEITEHEQPETTTTSPAPTRKTAGNAPREMGSEGANTEQDDVDGSTERAGHAGQPFDALTGQVEPRNNDIEIVERNTSGPDAKRAPVSQVGENVQVTTAARNDTGKQGVTAGETASHSNPQPSPLSGSDKPEAVSPPAVSGALSAMNAKSKADVIRLLRPFCRHADDTEKCGSPGGAKHCHTCQMLADAQKVPA